MVGCSNSHPATIESLGRRLSCIGNMRLTAVSRSAGCGRSAFFGAFSRDLFRPACAARWRGGHLRPGPFRKVHPSPAPRTQQAVASVFRITGSPEHSIGSCFGAGAERDAVREVSTMFKLGAECSSFRPDGPVRRGSTKQMMASSPRPFGGAQWARDRGKQLGAGCDQNARLSTADPRVRARGEFGARQPRSQAQAYPQCVETLSRR